MELVTGLFGWWIGVPVLVKAYLVYVAVFLYVSWALSLAANNLKEESTFKKWVDLVLRVMERVQFTLLPVAFIFALEWIIKLVMEPFRRIRFYQEFGFWPGASLEEKHATQRLVDKVLTIRAGILRGAFEQERQCLQPQTSIQAWQVAPKDAIKFIRRAKKEVSWAKTHFWRDGYNLAGDLGYSIRLKYTDYLN